MSTPAPDTIDIPYGQQLDAADVPYAYTVHQAQERFTKARAALYRADQQPIYGPEEHKARVGDLVAAFDSTVQPCITALETAAQEAETAVQAVQLDPVKRLNGTEGARAASLAPFVKEDFERLPLAELVEQCTSAAARGSEAELALCLRYGRQRVETERAQYPAMIQGGDGAPTLNQTRHPAADTLAALAAELNAINERTAPIDLPRKVAAAAQAKAELMALRRLAGVTRAGIDGTQARMHAEARARIGGRL